MALAPLNVGGVVVPVWPDKSPRAPIDTGTIASDDTGVAEGQGIAYVEFT